MDRTSHPDDVRAAMLDAMRAETEAMCRRVLQEVHAAAADRLADVMEAEAAVRQSATLPGDATAAFREERVLVARRTESFESVLDAFSDGLRRISDPREFARYALRMPIPPDFDAVPSPTDPGRTSKRSVADEPAIAAATIGSDELPHGEAASGPCLPLAVADANGAVARRVTGRGRRRVTATPPHVSRQWSKPSPEDPYWDLDGSVAQRERRQRARHRANERLVMLLASTLLVLMLARLADIDARDLAYGSGQPVLVMSLGADAVACLLVLVHETRRRMPPWGVRTVAHG